MFVANYTCEITNVDDFIIHDNVLFIEEEELSDILLIDTFEIDKEYIGDPENFKTKIIDIFVKKIGEYETEEIFQQGKYHEDSIPAINISKIVLSRIQTLGSA